MKSPIKFSPVLYVFTLYFAEGLPYVIVTGVSLVALKNLGISTEQVALWTSLISFPWTIKMFWGPIVGSVGNCRNWIILTEILIAFALGFLAVAVAQKEFISATLLLLSLMAFASATHDIAADGFYLLALGESQQAAYVGWRSTAYRLATIFGSGLLVFISGKLFNVNHDWHWAWQITFLIGGLVYGSMALINFLMLPKPSKDVSIPLNLRSSLTSFLSFFNQKSIFIILVFILFFRFPESLIGKLTAPFLMDPVEKGGLEMTNELIGLMTGTVGVAALLIGGICGGLYISKRGLGESLWLMVASLNIPNLMYLWAAVTRPGTELTGVLIAVDQFGYGFGFSAYMVFLLEISRHSTHSTARYAVATGLMAVSALCAGAISGYLQKWTSQFFPDSQYLAFFVIVCLMAIPSTLVAILALRLLKKKYGDEPQFVATESDY